MTVWSIHPTAAPRLQKCRQFVCSRLMLPYSAQRDVAVHASDSNSSPTAGQPVQAETGDTEVTFNYKSDGHYKATIEDVFEKAGGSKLCDEHAPWNLGWQTNERNIMWSDDLKLRLLKKIAAQKAAISEDELESQLYSLVNLLPGVQYRIASMKVEQLLKLMSEKDLVAQRLLALKAIFPAADCAKMLAAELSLLSEPVESVRNRAAELRAFLPAVNIDKLVEDNPCVLSVESFKTAVRDARRLMPGIDIGYMMVKDPGFILSLQKGTDLIPYDPVPGHDD